MYAHVSTDELLWAAGQIQQQLKLRQPLHPQEVAVRLQELIEKSRSRLRVAVDAKVQVLKDTLTPGLLKNTGPGDDGYSFRYFCVIQSFQSEILLRRSTTAF